MAAQASAGGSGMGMLIMLVLMFAVMYFFMIRPQQKEQKKLQKFQNELKPGTKVVVGGIYGTVQSVDLAKGVVDVTIASGVTIHVAKTSVLRDPSDAAAAASK